MSTRSFPGVKSGRDVTLTPHPILVPWPRKSRAKLYSPYGPYGLYRASVPVQGCTLPLPLPLLVIWNANCFFPVIVGWVNECTAAMMWRWFEWHSFARLHWQIVMVFTHFSLTMKSSTILAQWVRNLPASLDCYEIPLPPHTTVHLLKSVGV